MATWTPGTKATATHAAAAKNAATFTNELEAGGAQRYNEPGVTYNQANVRYNSLKPATVWTAQAEN